MIQVDQFQQANHNKYVERPECSAHNQQAIPFLSTKKYLDLQTPFYVVQGALCLVFLNLLNKVCNNA